MNSHVLDSAESGPRLPRLRFSLLALLIFTTVVCLALAWFVRPRHVVAEARLQVLAIQPTLTGDPKPLDAREYETLQETQLTLLKSFNVLQAAVRNPYVASLPILSQLEDPVEWLTENIEAEFINESEILSIRLRGEESDADDLKQIVDAVVKAYDREVLFAERQRRMFTRDEKAKMAIKLREQISEKHVEIERLTKESGPDSAEVRVAQLDLEALMKAYLQTRLSLKMDDIEMEAPARIRFIPPVIVRPD